ncbi:hypothetical protein [Actinospica robiniae]|uniref:hypothetical protein n=1 Tax=Actinospica robiniae TaxID=304901 RepID=UPI0012FB6024|nr:hypothetical protein [Actinospica robiniae]
MKDKLVLSCRSLSDCRGLIARDVADLRRIGRIQHGDPDYFMPGIKKLIRYCQKIGKL